MIPDEAVSVPTAYIVKRGDCNYYQKAVNAHKVGAKLVIVVLNDEDEDPETVIPVKPEAFAKIRKYKFDQLQVFPPYDCFLQGD